MGRPAKNTASATSVQKAPVEKTAKPATKKVVPKEPNETDILKAQVEALMKMVTELKSNSQVQSMSVVEPKEEKDEIPEEIPFRQYIKVMSLTNNRLSLSTERHGRGTVYNFSEFGQIQSIFYDDLAKIIHNNKRFTEQGCFYILDKRVIRLHNLEGFYEKFLSKQQIEGIMSLDLATMTKLLENTSQHIKNTVASIVLEKMMAGEGLDLNKVSVISKLSGKDVSAILRNIQDREEVDD